MKKLFSLILALTMLVASAAFAESYTIGTNPEFPPFEYVDDNGEIAGIDVEIVEAIFAKIDPEAEIVFEAMDFDAIIPAMVSGRVDIGAAAFSVTEERKVSVDFSIPYFDAVQAIIVKADSDIETEEDLVGKKIGVQLGTTGDIYVTTYIESEISRFNKGIDAVQDVIAGRLDAVVIDDAPAGVFVSQSEELKLLDVKLNSGNEQYALAIAKGNEELLSQIDAALEELIADGTISSIIASFQG
ncbi:MAG: transporter substrate-binding domain-containing protein [Clostridia bacterium]|nr:transporter substrate-binding domain-containing protein [Clostridia bacterium]